FAPLWERSPAIGLLLFASAFAAAIWIAGRAESLLGEHDSGKIVIDEVLAMAAALFGIPLTLPFIAAGFAAFRALDVIKPFPAGWIDRRIPGGAGVMLDDLVAAVYANLALRVMWYFL
ncbi:MAG: phosphatidylglycerophosphatase A family protein, partial [Candidatus Binataceae bacterium]